MNLKNCKRCGKIIQDSAHELCPMCNVDSENEFKSIKEYLSDNPGGTIADISKELGISIQRIKMYLRSERLEIVNKDGETTYFLTCGRCKKPINTGKYCDDCSRGLMGELKSTSNDIKSSIENDKNKSKSGFKYINKDK